MEKISTEQKSKIREQFNAKLDDQIKKFYETVPFGNHQLESSEINIDYYIRHNIETILRIRLARIADSKVMVCLTKNNPKVAKKWAQYVEDEMLHDQLFVNDLKKVGIEKDYIYSQDPFVSTKLLQGFLYYTIEKEDPIGLITKSYFLEYITMKTQPFWVDNIAKLWGDDYVKGHRGHLDVDSNEDHSLFTWDVLMDLANTNEEMERIEYYLNIYYGLICGYFDELYNSIVIGTNELNVSIKY